MFNEITVGTLVCGNIAYTNNIVIDATALYNGGMTAPRLGAILAQHNRTFKQKLFRKVSKFNRAK